jgi:hypothetical protein
MSSRIVFVRSTAAAGLLLLLSGLTVGRFASKYRFSGDPRVPESSTALVTMGKYDLLGPGTVDGQFSINYPAEIRENSSGTVQIRFTVLQDSRPNWVFAKMLVESTPLPIILASTAISVEPSEPQAFDSNHPDLLKWTLTPKFEGQHLLSVRFSDVLRAHRPFVTKTVMINGATSSLDSSSTLVLPVSVYTSLGITRAAFDITRYLFAVIGFVLTVPFLQNVYKRCFPLKHNRDPSPPIRMRRSRRGVGQSGQSRADPKSNAADSPRSRKKSAHKTP